MYGKAIVEEIVGCCRKGLQSGCTPLHQRSLFFLRLVVHTACLLMPRLGSTLKWNHPISPAENSSKTSIVRTPIQPTQTGTNGGVRSPLGNGSHPKESRPSPQHSEDDLHTVPHWISQGVSLFPIISVFPQPLPLQTSVCLLLRASRATNFTSLAKLSSLEAMLLPHIIL